MYANTFKNLAKKSKPQVMIYLHAHVDIHCCTSAHTFIHMYCRKYQVLYPVIKETPEAELPARPAAHTPYCAGYDFVFLSLNRCVCALMCTALVPFL